MDNKLVDAHSLPIEVLMERWKVSFTYTKHHFTGERDEHFNPIYEVGDRWTANAPGFKSGVGKTPREAIVKLINGLE
jgi:hypothetical protein